MRHFLVFVLAPLTLAAASCGLHLTTTDKTLMLGGEQFVCTTLVPLIDGIPPGMEAAACALAEDATKAIPTSEAAVRRAVKVAVQQPPVTEGVQHVADATAYHGKIVDRRARMGWDAGKN